MTPRTIYALVGPDRRVHYVGQSVNPRQRAQQHWCDPNRRPWRQAWERWLSEDPARTARDLRSRRWVALDQVPAALVLAEEAGWITAAAGLGEPLSNQDYPQLSDAAWLRRRYLEEGASIRAIAGELECSVGAVHQALARAGIETRSPGNPQDRVRLELPPAAELKRMADESSIRAVARRYGCAWGTIRARLED